MPHPIRRPRRTLAALGTGLAAIAVAIGSGADFTAHSENPGNRFSAGTLTIDNIYELQQFFGDDNLRPGGTPTRATIEIGNSGTIPARFSLGREDLESHDAGNDAAGVPFSAKLNIGVYDCGSYQAGQPHPDCSQYRLPLYEGTLESMSARVDLGRFEPRQYHYYEFVGQLDASAGNEFQGDWASTTFAWDAVQTGG